MLYLLTPSIWTVCFMCFQLWNVAGREYFAIDASLDLTKRHGKVYSEYLMWCLAGATPGLLLYAVLLPAGAILYLRNPRRRADPSVRFRMGLLYTGYREERWWWEVVIFGRKLMLILVVTFASQSQYQAIFAMGLLLVLFHMQHSHQP